MALKSDGQSFVVNTTISGTQRYGDITALSGGGFATIWADGDNSIRLQRLDAAGTGTGAEILVNTPADAIQLARSAFVGLSAGKLSKDSFATISSTAQKVEGNDRILYDKSNGALYYDANGGDAGGRTLFALLTNKPVIDQTDFFVI